MEFIRVTILVHGFTVAEIAACLPDLLDEFSLRYWLANPHAAWEAARGGLVVSIDYEELDPQLCGAAVLAEVQDCVFACLEFSSAIRFELLSASPLSPA